MAINQTKFLRLLRRTKIKTFQAVNFGCRVNAAETNQLSQILADNNFHPSKQNPKIILVNTCSITKKGQDESIRKVKSLRRQSPQSIILVTGCAQFDKIKKLDKVHIFNNHIKQKILQNQNSYTPQIGDKFSQSQRFILKIQSGCNHFCAYCIVPFRRPLLWSITIPQAINTINSAYRHGYREIIITGTNLNLYTPGLSNLLINILQQTKVPLISFGSIPLNCINKKFLRLYKQPSYSSRLSHFLHIPIQSGSNKILKLMNRPYTRQDVFRIIKNLKLKIKNLSLGTDIIVGFPGESQKNFSQTHTFCQKIGFKKIHVFRYSPRPGTSAQKLFNQLPKIKNSEKIRRSRLICQTTLPFDQKP